MNSLSKCSIGFAVIGVLLFATSYAIPNSFEPLMVSGFSALLIGMLLSFGAMFRSEQGKTKFLAVAVFFLLSFIISWNEPLQIVKLLTWMKN
jgi:hypothetical protein